MANSSKSSLIILLMLLFGVPSFVCAQGEQTITVAQRLAPVVDLKQSFVVVSQGNQIVGVAAATYIEAPEGDEGWLVSRIPAPTGADPLRVLFAMVGAQGDVRSGYQELHANALSPLLSLGLSAMQDRFVERRGVYRQLQTSMTSLEGRLQELQQDADAIANVNKLVNAEDELSEVRASLSRVRAAQDGIQHRLANMRALEQPLGGQRREAELVEQLQELSTALSLTENAALKKISAAASDLQSKLKAIEETRDEHVGLLEEELMDIQRNRQKK
jgi:hypothetical protein